MGKPTREVLLCDAEQIPQGSDPSSWPHGRATGAYKSASRSALVGLVFSAMLIFSNSAWAKDAGDDHCLDEFFGRAGPTNYSTTGKDARLEGTFKLVMAMDKNGTSGHGYYVEGKEGNSDQTKHYTLVFGQDPPNKLVGGSKVAVTGKLNGAVLSVNSSKDPASFKITESAPVAATTGNLSVNVILVNFLDSTLAATPADIAGVCNAALTNFYQEASYGKLNVSCTIKGPYQINYNGIGRCDYGTWAGAADAAANTTSGYRLYVLAPSGCGWGGLAYMPGNQAWINGSYWSWKDAYSHEFGHNIGMHHATYAGSEYADHSCCMGNPGNPPHCNAPHKSQMGWMAAGTTATVNNSGTYSFTLNALELNTTSTQIIKLPKADTGDNFYISYRAPIGLDATNLEGGYQYVTSIHHYSSGSSWTYLQALIGDGQSYTDSINGVTITQTSHTATSSSVSISFVTNAPPVISSGPWANPDPVDLPNPTTVSVIASDPDNGPTALTYTWYLYSGPGNVSFSPNGTTGSASSTASFSVPGTYTLRVNVSDGNATTSANCSVTVRDPNMVNAPSNLSASGSGKTVTLNWTGNSNNEEGFYVERAVKPKGNGYAYYSRIATLGVNATSYSETVATGTYLYRVQAFSISLNKVSSYSNAVSIRIR